MIFVTAPLVRTTHLAVAYRRYLNTANSPNFAKEVDERYSTATLACLLSRGDVELRRAAALSLGILGDHRSIEDLGRALADSDRGVRFAADDSFRTLLLRDAAPVHHQKLLQMMHLNDGNEYAGALAPTMILCDQAPLYAEAHHQLAICWHGLENFDKAASAYSACLWNCRYHYLAWQGLARCRTILGDYEGALLAFKHSISVNPDLESARCQIRFLQRRLKSTDDRLSE